MGAQTNLLCALVTSVFLLAACSTESTKQDSSSDIGRDVPPLDDELTEQEYNRALEDIIAF